MAFLELCYEFQFPETQSLRVRIWNQGKWLGRHATQVDKFVHQNGPTPYSPKSTPLWILEQFAATPSTWGFYFPRLGSAL